MEFGSWGWKSASDRPGWGGGLSRLDPPGSPYQTRAASGPACSSGPLIVPQGVWLMHHNEPPTAPWWPGGDSGAVTSPVFLPPPCQSVLLAWQEVRVTPVMMRTIRCRHWNYSFRLIFLKMHNVDKHLSQVFSFVLHGPRAPPPSAPWAVAFPTVCWGPRQKIHNGPLDPVSTTIMLLIIWLE